MVWRNAVFNYCHLSSAPVWGSYGGEQRASSTKDKSQGELWESLEGQSLLDPFKNWRMRLCAPSTWPLMERCWRKCGTIGNPQCTGSTAWFTPHSGHTYSCVWSGSGCQTWLSIWENSSCREGSLQGDSTRSPANIENHGLAGQDELLKGPCGGSGGFCAVSAESAWMEGRYTGTRLATDVRGRPAPMDWSPPLKTTTLDSGRSELRQRGVFAFPNWHQIAWTTSRLCRHSPRESSSRERWSATWLCRPGRCSTLKEARRGWAHVSRFLERSRDHLDLVPPWWFMWKNCWRSPFREEHACSAGLAGSVVELKMQRSTTTDLYALRTDWTSMSSSCLGDSKRSQRHQQMPPVTHDHTGHQILSLQSTVAEHRGLVV